MPVRALRLEMNRNLRRLAALPGRAVSGWAIAPWPGMTWSMLEVGMVTCQPSLRVRGSSSR